MGKNTHPYSNFLLFLGGCGDLQNYLQISFKVKKWNSFVYINAKVCATHIGKNQRHIHFLFFLRKKNPLYNLHFFCMGQPHAKDMQHFSTSSLRATLQKRIQCTNLNNLIGHKVFSTPPLYRHNKLIRLLITTIISVS